MKFIILAGGSGTRLFPLSRENLPKQFLRLFSNYSLIQETILRLDNDNFLIVSSQDSFYKLKEQLQEINKYKENRILLEPFGKNTAPAIVYALTTIENDDIVAVLPSDHYIEDKEEFLKTVSKAEKLAQMGYITTIGIVPTYPETGYGYIELEKEIGNEMFKVKRFVEKPNKEKAEEYLQKGNFLWNAGMFVLKKSVFLNELKEKTPELYDFYLKLKNSKNQEDIKGIYEKVEKISVDYAVMEKSDKIASVKGNFGWNDIGGFKSLKEVLSKDSKTTNNGKFKKLNSIKSDNNLIFSDKPVISLINTHNKAIIDTKDVLLISDLNNSQEVKNIFTQTKSELPQIAKSHPDEERPWGKFMSLLDKEGFKVKWIKVKKGEKLSLQYHNKREEHWIIVKGNAIMTLGDKNFEVKKGDYIKIGLKELHTIEGIEDTEFIEVQMGDYLGEDDIVRLEDKYGRNK
jgi:mannose-1-phosphate guanylyltransferase